MTPVTYHSTLLPPDHYSILHTDLFLIYFTFSLIDSVSISWHRPSVSTAPRLSDLQSSTLPPTVPEPGLMTNHCLLLCFFFVCFFGWCIFFSRFHGLKNEIKMEKRKLAYWITKPRYWKVQKTGSKEGLLKPKTEHFKSSCGVCVCVSEKLSERPELGCRPRDKCEVDWHTCSVLRLGS